MPALIVLYGPPASGKSFALNKFIPDTSNYEILNIDTIIEHNPEYQKPLQQFKTLFSKYGNVYNIPKHLIKEANDWYNMYRPTAALEYESLLHAAIANNKKLLK